MRPVSSWTLLFLVWTLTAAPSSADDWPQWRGPQRDGVWRETGIISKFAKPKLDPIWRAPISSGYSGPTVAKGRVYVTDRVRKPKQIERVLCFDADTGRQLWKHEYDCRYENVSYEAGPRASVLVNDELAYSLGSMGHLFCFDAAKGTVKWKHDLNVEYKIRMPIWGIAASPIIENDLIIVHIGGEDNASIVAFNKQTGKEVWRALEDNASYSAPVIIDQANKRVLVCWTGERVVGLDPQTGKLYWEHPFEQRRMIINIADPVVHRNLIFLTNFFDGSLLLRFNRDELSVEKVWRRMGEDEKNTEALHSIISTPIITGAHIYGCCSYGELRCLDLLTGDRVWQSSDAVPRARWANIYFVKTLKNIWMFNKRGQLIISNLSAEGFKEISRAQLIDPTTDQLNRRGGVCWSHPAFANKRVYARNDKELLCTSLSDGE